MHELFVSYTICVILSEVEKNNARFILHVSYWKTFYCILYFSIYSNKKFNSDKLEKNRVKINKFKNGKLRLQNNTTENIQIII